MSKKVTLEEARALISSINGGAGAVKGPITAWIAVFDVKRWPGRLKVCAVHGVNVAPPLGTDESTDKAGVKHDGMAQVFAKNPALYAQVQSADGKSGIVGAVSVKGVKMPVKGIKLPKRFTQKQGR